MLRDSTRYLDQFPRELREDARPCGIQNDVVLDAHTAPSGAVYSWLDRDDGPFGESAVGGA